MGVRARASSQDIRKFDEAGVGSVIVRGLFGCLTLCLVGGCGSRRLSEGATPRTVREVTLNEAQRSSISRMQTCVALPQRLAPPSFSKCLSKTASFAPLSKLPLTKKSIPHRTAQPGE